MFVEPFSCVEHFMIFALCANIVLSLFLQIENQKYSLLSFIEHSVCACDMSAHVIYEEKNKRPRPVKTLVQVHRQCRAELGFKPCPPGP